MIKNKYNFKKYLRPIKKIISKQINKLIIVLLALIVIFAAKIINYHKSNEIIDLLRTNINHKFNLREDSEKAIEVFEELKYSIIKR